MQPLKMTFMPNTIEHLGARLYSTLPPILAELVANSYDADATKVTIQLRDEDAGEKEIVVSDDGHGMSFQEINEKFLRIGRNRRKGREASQESPDGRKVIGKKGLGKLSFFGVAREIEIRTTKSHTRNSFLMKWGDIFSGEDEDRNSQKDYSPKVLEFNIKSETEKGTIVILRDIERVSDFDANSLADGLSKFFIIDSGFNIHIQHNDEEEILIENERKYSKLTKEIEWQIPEDIDLEYEKKAEVIGNLFAAEKPIRASTEMKGITLFSRKKLVSAPSYFLDKTSSHFFTYLTGSLEIDFIDDLGEDVIETNRQALNWEHPDMAKLLEYLQKLLRLLEADWRDKKEKAKNEAIEEIWEEKGESLSGWLDNVPEELNSKIKLMSKLLLRRSELSNEELYEFYKILEDLIPAYTYFNFLKLHRILDNDKDDEVFSRYKNEDYYLAVLEGVKRYVQEVRRKTESILKDKTLGERELLQHVFSLKNPQLSVTQKFRRPDGSLFSGKTMEHIKAGHLGLSVAVWDGFRNPTAHEPIIDLRDSGLYTEQDCLDALALLSHLFRRLDNSEPLDNSGSIES